MPGEVTVIATMKIRPDEVDRALELLRPVIEASHREEGCLKYTLHRATNEPEAFSIVERWRSQADLDSHFREPHMAPIADALKLLSEPPQILFCEPLETDGSEKDAL